MEIKAQVRLNPYDELELFYYDEYRDCVCFTFKEGYSICAEEYRLKDCKPISLEQQKAFIDKVQQYYDGEIDLILVQKLNTNKG